MAQSGVSKGCVSFRVSSVTTVCRVLGHNVSKTIVSLVRAGEEMIMSIYIHEVTWKLEIMGSNIMTTSVCTGFPVLWLNLHAGLSAN